MVRIQADAIVVTPDIIHAPGQLVVRDGWIHEVTPSCFEPADIRLDGQAILPGLINAHCHLEFSDLNQPIARGDSFPDWIRAVVQHRRQQTNGLDEAAASVQRAQAIAQGLKESADAGVVVVGDIVTRPWSAAMIPTNVLSPQVIAFAEVLGMSADRFEDSRRWAESISQLYHNSQGISESINAIEYSPHASYSIHFESLSKWLSTLKSERRLAFHLAESREELQWLATRKGAFQQLFEQLGITGQAIPYSIDDLLKLLAPFRSLVVHGNYLTAEQIEFVANCQRVSVVYCPRTHEYFEHTEYPLEQMLAAGVNVVFGTDSRASNPDLRLWNEVVTARNKHSCLSPAAAFAAVTIGAARALGIDHQFGSLLPGRRFKAISTLLTSTPRKDLLEELTLLPNSFRCLIVDS